MISDKFECIFVHIPKTAGQSVEHYFLNLHGLKWTNREPLLLRYNPDPAQGPERLAHLKASEYVDCGYMKAEDFKRYYKFAYVRNPWARLVSEYSYRKFQESFSFDDFVQEVLDGKYQNDDYSDESRHIIPQYDYLYDQEGNCLVDYVGKFESLDADFAKICQHLGFEESGLPHVNSSSKSSGIKALVKNLIKPKKKKMPKRHYTEYFSDKLRDQVAEIYQKDIEAFGYRFGD